MRTRFPEATWKGNGHDYGPWLGRGKPNVMLGHTTETRFWPTYSGGAAAPHVTYRPRTREFRQHLEFGRTAGALKGWSSSGGPTNHANVVQLEIICYSARGIAKTVGGLWVGDLTDAQLGDIARFVRWLYDEGWLTSTLAWSPGWTGTPNINEMSFDQWWYHRPTTFSLTGHDQNPDASKHWDPGMLDRYRLVELAGGATPQPPEEDDMFCKRGDNSETVQFYQERMNRLGYLPALGVDGAYGPKTATAVSVMTSGDGTKIGYVEANDLEQGGAGGYLPPSTITGVVEITDVHFNP